MKWPTKLDKLKFLAGTWVGSNTAHFYDTGSGYEFKYGPGNVFVQTDITISTPVDDQYEFIIGPGDTFISYRYSARATLPPASLGEQWSDAGYFGVHPIKHRLLMYTFCSDGTIRRGLEVQGVVTDTNCWLFQGTTLKVGSLIRWQIEIKRLSDDQITVTSFHRRKRAFQRWLTCSYLRQAVTKEHTEQTAPPSPDTARRNASADPHTGEYWIEQQCKEDYNKCQQQFAAIDWFRLYRDTVTGSVDTKCLLWSIMCPPGKDEFLSYLPESIYGPVSTPDNASWLNRLTFAGETDYKTKMKRLVDVLWKWGMAYDKDKLDRLAKVYPASIGGIPASAQETGDGTT